MWFSLPEGCSGIAVDYEHFECEIRDSDGRGYFRAPEHFAAKLLAIPGFGLAEPPEGAPEDLPRADPLRDSAIADLTKQNESLRIEIGGLRSDLEAMRAQLHAAEHERDELAKGVKERDAKLLELADLEEEK